MLYILEKKGLFLPKEKKLGFFSNDINKGGIIFEAVFKEIKSYMCRYVDENYVFGSTDEDKSPKTKMRFKGIPGKLLKPELYTQKYADPDKKLPHVVTADSMRKRHLNVTEKELEAGDQYYSVTCLQLSRTINPNIWNEENYDHNLGEWFPEGYENNKITGAVQVQNNKLEGCHFLPCSVEARESMDLNTNNENFLSKCQVY